MCIVGLPKFSPSRTRYSLEAEEGLYGLRTSPRAWEEERDKKLAMVIAYVDDLIAVGNQVYLDGMKAELDKELHRTLS